MGGSGGMPGPTLAVVAPQTAGAVPDRILTIEMATDEHPQARAAAAAGLLGHLQGHAADDDDVVAAHDPLLLHAEDLVEVHAAERDEGRRGVSRGTSELDVKGGDKPLPQVAVGRGHRRDAGDAQLVHEAILQGAVDALAPPPRGGGVAEDVFDAQACQDTATEHRPPVTRPA